MTDFPNGAEKNIADRAPTNPDAESLTSVDEQKVIESNDRWLFQAEKYFRDRFVRPEAYQETLAKIAHDAAKDSVRLADQHGTADAYAATLIHTLRRQGVSLYDPVVPGLDPILIGGTGLALVQAFAAAAGGIAALLGVGSAEAHVIPVILFFVTLYTMMRTSQEADHITEVGLSSIAIPYLPVLCFAAAGGASAYLGLPGVVLSSWTWLIGGGITLALALAGGGICKLVDAKSSYRTDWAWKAAAKAALRSRGFVGPNVLGDLMTFLEKQQKYPVKANNAACSEDLAASPSQDTRKARNASLLSRFGRPGDVVGTYTVTQISHRGGGPTDLSPEMEERGNKLSSHLLLSFALTTIGCAWYETHHTHLVMTGLYAILLLSMMIIGARAGAKAG